MRFEALRTIHRIEENRYVTPFCTKNGALFLVVSADSSPGEAYQEIAMFERISGLIPLAQPVLFPSFEEWLAKMLIEQLAKMSECAYTTEAAQLES